MRDAAKSLGAKSPSELKIFLRRSNTNVGIKITASVLGTSQRQIRRWLGRLPDPS